MRSCVEQGVYYILTLLKMARNKPTGDGHRIGAVRDRSQTYNPKTEQYVKRDTKTGQFMDVKKDGTKFKGVRTEKPKS
jgi:hypothetical protein